MFDTLRSRLLVILISFTICTIIISVFAFSYFVRSKDSLSEVSQKIEQINILLLKDIGVMHNFFENETINPSFFKDNLSPVLDSHTRLCKDVTRSLSELYDLQRLNDLELNDSISAFQVSFNKYVLFTESLVSKILARGFKDYGTEGRMRKLAHELELHEKEIGLINILQLRRHEKDYIIRQEDKYIGLHNDLIEKMRSSLAANFLITEENRNKIDTTIKGYLYEFRLLVKYERELGLKNNSGMKKSTDILSAKLESSLSSMVLFAKLREAVILKHVKLMYLIAGLVFILISIIVAIVISKRAFSSITVLKESIDEFVKSDFSKRTTIPFSNSANEIDILSSNFSIMEQHIVDQMKSLKQTNKDLEMLFYATSHDIQMPLLEGKSITEAALNKVNDPNALVYFGKINNSWSQLLNIIDELGIVTNVRNVEIQAELIDIEDLIKSIFAEFKMMPWFDNIIFSLEIKLQRKLYSSKSLLKIIFRNLIENGVKYATKRSTFSFLKISVSTENEDMIRILVADNGIGIKEEYQDKIFDMFFRGTTYTSGTGLGLYIVQNSLEKLNGVISVKSDENKGTAFTMLIPNNYRKKGLKDRIISNREVSSQNGQLRETIKTEGSL